MAEEKQMIECKGTPYDSHDKIYWLKSVVLDECPLCTQINKHKQLCAEINISLKAQE